MEFVVVQGRRPRKQTVDARPQDAQVPAAKAPKKWPDGRQGDFSATN